MTVVCADCGEVGHLACALGQAAKRYADAAREDPINHPSHYQANGFEAIDVIEAFGLGFCLGNVVKYVLRADRKTGECLQDLQKARWYLDREIARRGR